MSLLIKCHICKLDKGICNNKCTDIVDVSELYLDGVTEDTVLPGRFCTAHRCPHNVDGFTCGADICKFGRVLDVKTK